ncbi:hypothetical protein RFI_17458 [Reticulomyxa filosa]|uniref:Protein kinase domain-containing protein n=1 Tax=Reticulomyxa filosa TaxID=46433 RepID=X6N1I7_RETFI|nr:hypothetical protein RFI_17458 [Reticulomyxa filosa]|eukprot:ETO19773.1 hypothetical protein RFI_17458 [Reticulomyxa filosa]
MGNTSCNNKGQDKTENAHESAKEYKPQPLAPIEFSSTVASISATAKKNLSTPTLTKDESNWAARQSGSLCSMNSTGSKGEDIIINSKYRVVKRLGGGVSGDVLEVERMEDLKKFALKRLDVIKKKKSIWNNWGTNQMLSGTYLNWMFFEIKKRKEFYNFLLFLKRLVETFVDAKYYYLVTELGAYDFLFLYATKSEITGRIKNGQRIEEKLVKVIIRQLLQQLNRMHKQQIVHRDIKPENVVFMHGQCAIPKLIDFGDSLLIENDTKYYELAGTPCYLSPERWESHEGWQLKASDIWAIGVI